MFSVSEIMNHVLVIGAERLSRFGLKLSILVENGGSTHMLKTC